MQFNISDFRQIEVIQPWLPEKILHAWNGVFLSLSSLCGYEKTYYQIDFENRTELWFTVKGSPSGL